MRVAVAGGGIAGLTTAVALAERGIEVDLFERAPELAEIGAGIQLSPNATALLEKLGVLEHLGGRVCEPEALVIRDAASGDMLSRLPLGATARQRYGAPYCTLRRTDLQSALFAAARCKTEISLHLGNEVHAVRDAGAIVSFQAAGEVRQADILVAADGLRSQIRTGYFAHGGPRPLQHAAWRAVLPRAAIPETVDCREVGLWLGAGCHLVHYAVGGPAAHEAGLNVVLIGPSDPAPPTSTFGRAARRLIDAVPAWERAELFDVEASGAWVKGCVALVGDAAHAMAPSAAQGGAQAIEDAWVLAAELARVPSVREALARYQRARRPRVERVVRLAARNLHAYEFDRIAATLRNSLLKTLPARLMLSRLDWLFGWRPQ